MDLPADRTGVLPCQYLERAIEARVIEAGRFTIPWANVQPASLDLRLGEVAYRIRCSFLPGRESVERRVKDYVIDELDLRKDGVVLETKRPYLIPLKERLSLPSTMPLKDNFDYIVALGSNLAPVTVRLIPPAVNNDAMRAGYMIEAGCENQLNALLAAYSK